MKTKQITTILFNIIIGGLILWFIIQGIIGVIPSFNTVTVAQNPNHPVPNTGIAIMNVGDSSATLNTHYIPEQGNTFYLEHLNLASNENYVRFAEPEAATNFAGATIINSPQDMAAIVRTTWGIKAVGAYNAVSEGATLNILPLIFANYYDTDSFITIQNTNLNQPTDIMITYTPLGNAMPSFSNTITLAAGSITTINLINNTQFGTNWLGSATIHSTLPVVAVAHSLAVDNNFAYAYNAISQPTDTHFLPLISADYEGFTTYIQANNISTNNNTLSITYQGAIYDQDNTLIIDDYSCQLQTTIDPNRSILISNRPFIDFTNIINGVNTQVVGGTCYTEGHNNFAEAGPRFLGSATISTTHNSAAVVFYSNHYNKRSTYNPLSPHQVNSEIFSPLFLVDFFDTTTTAIVQNICTHPVIISSTLYPNSLSQNPNTPLFADITIPPAQSTHLSVSSAVYSGWVGSLKITTSDGDCLASVINDRHPKNEAMYSMLPRQTNTCLYMPYIRKTDSLLKENNATTQYTTPLCLNLLEINKTGPAHAVVNTPITYHLTVTNHHYITATNLIISDTLPFNTTYLYGGSLQYPVGSTLNEQTVTWQVDELAPNQSVTFPLTLTVQQNITGVITNSLYRVSATEIETVWGNKPVVTALSDGNPSLVYVVDEEGLLTDNVTLYYNGTAAPIITQTTGTMTLPPPTTGVFVTVPLYAQDNLVALKQVYQQATTRQAHKLDGDDNFAYRVYISNMAVSDDGAVMPFVIPASNQPYTLTVKAENTLILFNIVVSLEWDADEETLSTFKDAFLLASNYLYDATDGQMAFGWVTIYDNGEYWADADFQFSAKNTVRPHAYNGGLTNSPYPIRLGRFWDGYVANKGTWTKQNSYRTLIHQFAHYALHLHDEYITRVVDNNGNMVREQATTCSSNNIITNKQGTINGSLMYYFYNATEFIDKSGWNGNCRQTEQHRLNNGEADWETIMRYYSPSPPLSATWRLRSPDSRGGVMAGPEILPPQNLAFPIFSLNNAGLSDSISRELNIFLADGQAAAGVQGWLEHKGNGVNRFVEQGLSDANGQLSIYGAALNDTVHIASLDNVYKGSLIITETTVYTVYLQGDGANAEVIAKGKDTLLDRRRLSEAKNSSLLTVPYLTAIPIEDGTALRLTVAGLTTTSNVLTATIYSNKVFSSSYQSVLTYNATQAVYTGQINIDGVGSGQLNISNQASASIIRTNYMLQQTLATTQSSLYAVDGNLQLHLSPNSTADTISPYAIVLSSGYIPNVPIGRRILGQAYQVQFSEEVTVFDKAALLKLHLPLQLGYITDDIAIYRWSDSGPVSRWQWVGGIHATGFENSLVVPINKPGIYALLSTVPGEIYLPFIFK